MALCVADNGPGIEARHFDRIFRLFKTLAPRDRVESTGVGLALAKEIAEMYHARIRVESVPAASATFWFTLSTATAAPASRTSP
jgi:two-component system sensor kinase FixL